MYGKLLVRCSVFIPRNISGISRYVHRFNHVHSLRITDEDIMQKTVQTCLCFFHMNAVLFDLNGYFHSCSF